MPRAGLDEAAVLAAAAELADKDGLENFGLAKLAKELGIKTPSLYNHIDGLAGLRKKLTLHGLESMAEKLTKAAAGRSKDEAVKAIAKAYVKFAREHPGLYEAAQRPPHWEDENIKRAAANVVDPLLEVFKVYGLENERDAIHAVRGFRSLLHGFASLEQMGGFGMPVDLDESFQFMLSTFLDGLRVG